MASLQMIDPAHATGPLAEAFDRMRSRKMNPAYQTLHGGLPGIVRAHSLDAQLMGKVFALSGLVNGAGPMSWPHRELVAATTSVLNQCFY